MSVALAVIIGICVMTVMMAVIRVPGLAVLMMIYRSHNRTGEHERDGHQQCETQPDHEKFIKVPVTGGSIQNLRSTLPCTTGLSPAVTKDLFRADLRIAGANLKVAIDPNAVIERQLCGCCVAKSRCNVGVRYGPVGVGGRLGIVIS